MSAKVYDQFRRAYGDRSAKAALTKLVAWFVSQPTDVRELILSDISHENKARVLRAILKQMKR